MVAVAIGVGDGHRDDKTGGAKAALAAVMLHHRGLHGMRLALWASHTLDRADGFAVQLGQEQDAGGSGLWHRYRR